MEVKVDQTVHQQPETGNNPGSVNRLRKWALLLRKARLRRVKQHDQQHQPAYTSRNSCFRKKLDIIVVDVIDDEPVVVGFVFGIYRNKRPQPCSSERMGAKQVPCTLKHGHTAIA